MGRISLHVYASVFKYVRIYGSHFITSVEDRFFCKQSRIYGPHFATFLEQIALLIYGRTLLENPLQISITSELKRKSHVVIAPVRADDQWRPIGKKHVLGHCFESCNRWQIFCSTLDCGFLY